MPTALTLTAPNAAPLPVSVPTQWADVSLATFVALLAPEPGETRLPAEILCALPAGTLGQVAAIDAVYLANLLAFATDPAPVMSLLPTPGLPDIGTLPFGLLLEAEAHLSAHPDRPWLAYGPYLLALYRVHLAFGKYDEARVAACQQALLAAPVTEAYADAAFFLAQYRQLSGGTYLTPTMLRHLKNRNLKPGSKKSAIGSGRFSTWMRRLAAPC